MNELTFLSRAFMPTGAAAAHDVSEILALNEKTSERGLSLTPSEALEICECRVRSLRQNERVEVGIGAAAKLINTFSASTFASRENWAELLHAITECFYFIKTEVHDAVSDDRLIAFMFEEFENFCGGSFEILAERCDWLIRQTNGDDSEDYRGEKEDE